MTRNSSIDGAPYRRSVLQTAWHRALGDGLPGVAAQAAQVSTLMWLHTTLNYQYRHGTRFRPSVEALWREGGVVRLYRGFGYALALSPATRFLDTAANAGCKSLLDTFAPTSDLPLAVKTASGSIVAAVARLSLLPLDVLKTTQQVEGAAGQWLLLKKLQDGGPKIFFHGALASVTSSIISHFPWFYTYNLLDENLPKPKGALETILRSASIGFSAATMSALMSNWARVIKTYKQTHHDAHVSYTQIVRSIVTQGGVQSVFVRGLSTRIAINGIQSALFTVLWTLGRSSLPS